jgi:hypothetical protein
MKSERHKQKTVLFPLFIKFFLGEESMYMQHRKLARVERRRIAFNKLLRCGVVSIITIIKQEDEK